MQNRLAWGKWLKDKRLALGRTQLECAQLAGVDRSYWSRMESKGEVPMRSTIEGVVKAVEVSLDEALRVAG